MQIISQLRIGIRVLVSFVLESCKCYTVNNFGRKKIPDVIGEERFVFICQESLTDYLETVSSCYI